MTGPLRRLSGRSARSLSGFRSATSAVALRECDGSTPLCCPDKAQARWAAQRTTSIVACKTATCVRAAALLHWSHDRISLASRQVAISSALFWLQSWLPRSPTVVAVYSSHHHLLHVCFLTICCWFVFMCAPSSLAVLRYSVSILLCYSLLPQARRLPRPKSFGDGQETVGTGRSKPKPVVVTSLSCKLPRGVDGLCCCWRVCFSWSLHRLIVVACRVSNSLSSTRSHCQILFFYWILICFCFSGERNQSLAVFYRRNSFNISLSENKKQSCSSSNSTNVFVIPSESDFRGHVARL